MGDQMDRLDQRTERSIERIKQRAADQGRGLTIQEQRRIDQIQEDAALRREDISERHKDAQIQTGATILGGVIGGIIGTFVGPVGTAVGVGIGASAGSQIGRLGGNLFHTAEQDMFAIKAGMKTAQFTENNIRSQNLVNSRDFANNFVYGFEKQAAQQVTKVVKESGSTQPTKIEIHNTFKLNNRELGYFVDEIIAGQSDGTLPKFQPA